MVWLQATAVIDDVVMCGSNTAASHCLAHDKEVIPGNYKRKKHMGVRRIFLKAKIKMIQVSYSEKIRYTKM